MAQDVVAENDWERPADIAQFGVDVKEVIVTLTGHVSRYAKQWDPEGAAQGKSGTRTLLGISKHVVAKGARYVMGIASSGEHVAVKPKVSLIAVISEIDTAFKRRAKADAQKISVEVLGAEVTLTGTVRSWSARELARRSAWGTPGVRNVVDKITVVY